MEKNMENQMDIGAIQGFIGMKVRGRSAPRSRSMPPPLEVLARSTAATTTRFAQLAEPYLAGLGASHPESPCT